jgi:hypothetical protein
MVWSRVPIVDSVVGGVTIGAMPLIMAQYNKELT